MRKYIIHILTAAACALTLFSCSKESSLEPARSNGQMRFAVTVDGATKASIGTADLTEFYLQVTSPDADFCYFETISNDGEGNWSASKPLYWKNEDAVITYTAAYYGALGQNYFNVKVTEDQFTEGASMALLREQSTQENLNAADLLSMKSTELSWEKAVDGVVPVTLGHALSKVNFVLTLDELFAANNLGLETNLCEDLFIEGVCAGFNFKPLTGVVTAETDYGKTTVSPYLSDYSPVTEYTPGTPTATAEYESILVPQTFAAGDLKVNFSILGVDYQWKNSEEIVLAQGGEYTIPVAVAYQGQPGPPVPPAPLSGIFTINANGDKVNFSRGNLQATYDGADWSWTFAENQWDYLGEGGANLLIVENGVLSAPGTVDYFNWSVEDSYFGIYPVMIGGKFANYELGEFRDWGEALGFGWRTLSEPEWDYLLNGRASGSTVNSVSDARYTRGVINTDGTSVNGLILFPEGVTIEASEATAWGDINEYTFASGWGTKCTTAQWTALAAKGCVFLPAAGMRSYYTGNTKYWYASLINEAGYYWTSTKTTDYRAYAAYFRYNYDQGQYKIMPDDEMSRNEGMSVRLVKPVPSN